MGITMSCLLDNISGKFHLSTYPFEFKMNQKNYLTMYECLLNGSLYSALSFEENVFLAVYCEV